MSSENFPYHLDLTKTSFSPVRQAELATYAAVYGPIFTSELRELITKAKEEGMYTIGLIKVASSEDEFEGLEAAMTGVIKTLNDFDGSYYLASWSIDCDELSYELHVSWWPNHQYSDIDDSRGHHYRALKRRYEEEQK